MAQTHQELVDAVKASAARLGIHPSDLLTAISYESAGTFSPTIKGPVTQHGQHIGLIQAGEPQRKKYGINPEAPLPEQFSGIERYLQDAGVKPGMGLLDLYSAINAGRVGRYNASDANKGGAPGTVADKVATQMVGHRLRANQLLGLPAPGSAAVAPDAVASVPAQGAGIAPAPSMSVPTAAPVISAETAALPAVSDMSDTDFQQLLALVRQQQPSESAQLQPMRLPDLRRRPRPLRTAALRR